MSIEIAVALLALLVALFALVALVAVYARVRALEAGRAAELSGYASVVGRPAPLPVQPEAGQRGAVVAVLDANCALCHGLWDALGVAAEQHPAHRFAALVDRPDEFRPAGRAELVVDPAARAEVFEGYAPTLLDVGPTGIVRGRTFVYSDTDLPALMRELLAHPTEATGLVNGA
ncbi:hypothetical protein [Pseudonocardia sp. GCM10023141]|uniref:hypothetical protein n=1 Tax=Pseudonocardia sp. GCM10023141 TaxID=3252653 RepID=UPI0036200A3A